MQKGGTFVRGVPMHFATRGVEGSSSEDEGSSSNEEGSSSEDEGSGANAGSSGSDGSRHMFESQCMLMFFSYDL